MVLYPDVFKDDQGRAEETRPMEEFYDGRFESGRWPLADTDGEAEELKAVLPLALVLGAIVTPYLDAHVTHVLVRSSYMEETSALGKRRCFSTQDRHQLITLEKTILIAPIDVVSLWDQRY